MVECLSYEVLNAMGSGGILKQELRLCGSDPSVLFINYLALLMHSVSIRL